MKIDMYEMTLFVPSHPMGTDFYIKAVIEVESYGAKPDPWGDDPGAGAEWSCTAIELWHDCGGEGERVWGMGCELFDHLRGLVEDDGSMREQVEENLSKIAKDAREEGRDYDADRKARIEDAIGRD